MQSQKRIQITYCHLTISQKHFEKESDGTQRTSGVYGLLAIPEYLIDGNNYAFPRHVLKPMNR